MDKDITASATNHRLGTPEHSRSSGIHLATYEPESANGSHSGGTEAAAYRGFGTTDGLDTFTATAKDWSTGEEEGGGERV